MMHRAIKTLVLLVMGLACLVPPPPVYGEEGAGVQEEREADEWKAWERFNDGFNREEAGRQRQFLEGQEHLIPVEWTALSLIPESLQSIFRITPTAFKDQFRSFVYNDTKVMEHKQNGSIWETDRDQHGGSKWKVWLDKRKWENEHKTSCYSIRENGEVRKGPKQ